MRQPEQYVYYNLDKSVFEPWTPKKIFFFTTKNECIWSTKIKTIDGYSNWEWRSQTTNSTGRISNNLRGTIDSLEINIGTWRW